MILGRVFQKSQSLIHCMVSNDRHLTVQPIAKPIGITSGSVHIDLIEILGMRKLCQMSPKNANARVHRHFQETSDSLPSSPKEFPMQINYSRWNLGSPLRAWIKDSKQTIEKLWCSIREPECFYCLIQRTKRISNQHRLLTQWMLLGFFYYSEGVIMIDYFEKGNTINGQYFASKLRQQKKEIKSKHKEYLRTSEFLLQDSVPIHMT